MLKNLTQSDLSPLERLVTSLIEDEDALEMALGDQFGEDDYAIVIIWSEADGTPLPPESGTDRVALIIEGIEGNNYAQLKFVLDCIAKALLTGDLNETRIQRAISREIEVGSAWVDCKLMTQEQVKDLVRCVFEDREFGKYTKIKRFADVVNSLTKEEISSWTNGNPTPIIKTTSLPFLSEGARKNILEILVDNNKFDFGFGGEVYLGNDPVMAQWLVDYAIALRGGIIPGSKNADSDLRSFEGNLERLVEMGFDFSKYRLTAPAIRLLEKIPEDKKPKELRLLLPWVDDRADRVLYHYGKQFNMTQAIVVGMDPRDVDRTFDIPVVVTDQYYLLD